MHTPQTHAVPGEFLNYGPRKPRKFEPKPEAPKAAPVVGQIPHNWARRREALLSRQDNIAQWHTPWGFVEAYNLDGTHMAQELELQYLERTQDRDIAPSFEELRINYRRAVSLDAPVLTDEDDQVTLAEAIPDEGDHIGTPYEPPDRREEWLRREDEYRWYCGPVQRAQFIVQQDGSLGITATSTTKSPEWTLRWLQSLVAEHKQQGALPCPESLVGAAQELKLRRDYYGDNWYLSLLTPAELEGFNQWVETQKMLDEANATDFQRVVFTEQDQAIERKNSSVGYAGPRGELGITWNAEDEGFDDEPEPWEEPTPTNHWLPTPA